MKEKLKEIGQITSREELLLHLAEECAELSHACLKMVRAYKGIAYMPYGRCVDNLAEELADVSICMRTAVDVMPEVEQAKRSYEKEKINRWYLRACTK